MLHRRLLYFDSIALAEALNEKAYGEGLVVTGVTQIIFGNPDSRSSKFSAKELYYQPFISFHKKEEDIRIPELKVNLPPEIHILTLKKLGSEDTLLLRLEHIFSTGIELNLSL